MDWFPVRKDVGYVDGICAAMIHFFALKSALALAAKNTACTLALSVPFALIIAGMPEIKVDLVVYGIMGGLTRWIAAKCEWKDGLGGCIVGIFMALGFEGASVPFIKDLVTGDLQQIHCAAYAYGLVGNIIFDWVVSFARMRAEA